MTTPEEHDRKLVAAAVKRFDLTVHQAHQLVETCDPDTLLTLTRDVLEAEHRERMRWVTTVRIMFAWYDMWVGVYWDRTKRKIYICPLPMVCVVVKLRELRRGIPKAERISPPSHPRQ